MCDVAERLEKMGMEKGKEEEKIRVYKKLIEKGFSEQEAQEITEFLPNFLPCFTPCSIPFSIPFSIPIFSILSATSHILCTPLSF